MKKRLLLVLTIVMLMCIAAFSASAASCGSGNHTVATRTVAPTCEDQGYTVTYCAKCGEEFSKGNYTTPTGHEWVNKFVEEGTYYRNERTCTNSGCDKKNEIEKEGGRTVQYYSVQFINAKATGAYLDKIPGTDIGVKHAKLTGAHYNQALSSKDVYIKEGGSFTYTGKKPTRNKDLAYGKYEFVGWTQEVTEDSTGIPQIGTADDYNVTIENIQKNTVYYACWKGVDVIYKIQFVNEDGSSWISANNGEVQVKHGDKIDYKWIYPSKTSTTSADYNFIGWGCGDATKTDASGNKTQYDQYLIKDIHIKEVPIYSGDALKAVYEAVPRKYKTSFDLKGETLQANVDFGSSLDLVKSGNNYTITVDGVTKTVLDEYRDDNYVYEFNGNFVTDSGHQIKSGSFSVPQYTLDYNDIIYLEYADSIAEDKKVKVGNDYMVLENPNVASGKTLFDYVEEEQAYYEYCKNNVVLYEPIYFDLNERTYLFPVSEHGHYIFDKNGNRITLEITLHGIYRVDTTGAREAFDRYDAADLRLVKVEPSYRSLIRSYPFIVEIVMPVVIDGETVESEPLVYNDLLTVQVTNQNNKLLARGNTGNNINYPTETYKDSKGNTYARFYCVLYVERAEKYNISVASNDNREKYVGEKTLFWSTYKSMYNNENNTLNNNVIVDISISADYNQGLNCYCLCHGIFKGLWTRMLNILYSLFKVQYQCCPHMHATIGDGLAY